MSSSYSHLLYLNSIIKILHIIYKNSIRFIFLIIEENVLIIKIEKHFEIIELTTAIMKSK